MVFLPKEIWSLIFNLLSQRELTIIAPVCRMFRFLSYNRLRPRIQNQLLKSLLNKKIERSFYLISHPTVNCNLDEIIVLLHLAQYKNRKIYNSTFCIFKNRILTKPNVILTRIIQLEYYKLLSEFLMHAPFCKVKCLLDTMLKLTSVESLKFLIENENFPLLSTKQDIILSLCYNKKYEFIPIVLKNKKIPSLHLFACCVHRAVDTDDVNLLESLFQYTAIDIIFVWELTQMVSEYKAQKINEKLEKKEFLNNYELFYFRSELEPSQTINRYRSILKR